MPRSARVTVPHALHHIYARGVDKRQLFFDPEDYKIFLKRVQIITNDHDASMVSWALLPDVFHLFLRVNDQPLSRFMSRLLTSYSMYYNHKYSRSGPLIQSRYGSKVVQDDPYFMHVSRYILLSPVEAGITHDPRNYEYSSMQELLGKSALKILDQKALEKLIGAGERATKNYLTFILDGIKSDISEYNPFKNDRDILGSARFYTHRIRPPIG